tara:strand:- start:1 stop:489 length:489 start_codon:yes stop_codon:yes gene_type:complete
MLRRHWEEEREKQDPDGVRLYPEAVHVRTLLLKGMNGSAPKSPKPPKAETTVDLSMQQLIGRIASIWDEEMPKHLSRISQRSKAREKTIRARWEENSDLECWRWAFRALAKDEFHMKRKAPIDYFLRPTHFAKWIEAGETLKNKGRDASAHRSILEEIDNGL